MGIEDFYVLIVVGFAIEEAIKGSVETMTVEQVQVELRSYSPGTAVEVVGTWEVDAWKFRIRRQALWRRLDHLMVGARR